MYLVAHTTGIMEDTGEVFAVEGKTYNIIEENEFRYEVRDENGVTHSFSKEADSDGLSYKSWFNLAE